VSDPGLSRASGRGTLTRSEPTNLGDILERVLDKGIVIAGDIAINLVDIELLTIKIRLLISSVDKAREIGIDWWSNDPWLSSAARDGQRAGLERPGAQRSGRSLPAGSNGAGRDGDSPALAERLDRIESVLVRLADERSERSARRG
jgi:hypothetical protein